MSITILPKEYVKKVYEFLRTYVRLHESMVSYYTDVVCQVFDIAPDKVITAAEFHDHGKFLWGKELFTKLPQELTDEDWRVIRSHPIDAKKVIFKFIPEKKSLFIKGDPSIIEIIEMHHEKPNGKGYYGIKDIPIEVALIEVADVFDACVSDRMYRKMMSPQDAAKIAVLPFKQYFQDKGYDADLLLNTLVQTAVGLSFIKSHQFVPKTKQ